MHNELSKIKIVVGLGNPGRAYECTYHNVGLLALETLSTKAFRRLLSKHFSFSTTGAFTLVKPLTYMNLSGAAVRAALLYFNVKPESMLVVHDDSDIPLGAYKFSFGRGAAGHRGIESLIRELGTKDFWRFRVGIRKTAGKARSFVLRKIAPADKKVIYSVFRGLTEKLTRKESP